MTLQEPRKGVSSGIAAPVPYSWMGARLTPAWSWPWKRTEVKSSPWRTDRTRGAGPGPAGLLGQSGGAVRLLHTGHDPLRQGPAGPQPRSHGRGDTGGHRREPLPLHGVCEHRAGDQSRRRSGSKHAGIHRSGNLRSGNLRRKGQERAGGIVSAERPAKGQNDYAVIGKPVAKIDGRDKVTGTAKYTGDLKIPNMLHGKILPSPHAHARILSIDTSEAEKIPGVKAVITHKDAPSTKYGLSPYLLEGASLWV